MAPVNLILVSLFSESLVLIQHGLRLVTYGPICCKIDTKSENALGSGLWLTNHYKGTQHCWLRLARQVKFQQDDDIQIAQLEASELGFMNRWRILYAICSTSFDQDASLAVNLWSRATSCSLTSTVSDCSTCWRPLWKRVTSELQWCLQQSLSIWWLGRERAGCDENDL